MIKNLIRYSIILCLISLLQGCEVLSMISKVLPSATSGGITTDLQLGDKSVDNVGKSSARDIILDDGGTVKIDSRTINTGISPWWLALGLIFWQLPKFTESIRKGWNYARSKSPSK